MSPNKPTSTVPVRGCALVDGRTLATSEGAGATVGNALAAGAGETVKSVKRLAVVCDATTVPSRQTCEPVKAPGAIT